MGNPLTLALGDDSTTTLEPWVTADLLGYAQAEETVDLTSVCVVASQILYILSGRRFGVRTETLRPVAGQRDCGWGDLTRAQYRSDPGASSQLTLKSPVRTITSVKVDGIALATNAYQLYDNRTLVRLQDASGLSFGWPVHQRLELPDTAVGTFSVTYTWGVPVPEGGKMAAQVFATELARYINKDQSAFADRTVNIARQGVTQILDPTPFLGGSTGLYFVDAWIKTINPHGARRRPSITSPESIMNARAT